jgi:predicted outer membrane repeat protein
MIRIKKTLQKVSGLVGMCLLLGVISLQAATLTVTTTADAGVGSLRQAIIDAAINAAANNVTFNIPTTDPGYNAANNRFTINLLSSLPNLPSAPITIDNTQPQGVTVMGNTTFRIFTLVDSAVVTINNLTISNGFSSGLGGGFLMGNSSTLNLNRSTVSNNAATDGGGIYINQSGTLNINASTVSGNSATNGGGVFNNTSGTINATSNTFDGNSATGNGGGIYNTATITFTNNTITSNTAANGGGIYNNFTATLNNNLVALNTASDGNDLLGRGSLGNAFTGTYNLVGNADGSEGLGGATNQSGSTISPIDPLLGPLQNNGGPTFTRALLTGSPAIDKGNSPTLITDQRGQARPQDNPLIANTGNGADIGAFEAPLAPTAASVSISGRVITPRNFGLTNAWVTLTDAQGNSQTIRTGKSGSFRFTDVAAGETYIISVSARRYTFAPQVITVNEDIVELNFYAQ